LNEESSTFMTWAYVSGPISNCELVNLEDMLQNGIRDHGTLIEKPHSFSTACNIRHPDHCHRLPANYLRRADDQSGPSRSLRGCEPPEI
jgi:hypothetical protein